MYMINFYALTIILHTLNKELEIMSKITLKMKICCKIKWPLKVVGILIFILTFSFNGFAINSFVQIPYSFNPALENITDLKAGFWNNDKGIMMVERNKPNTTILYNSIWKTKNGGQLWEKVYLDDVSCKISDFMVTDSVHGFILCSDVLIKTNDGGDSWKKIPLPFKGSNFYFLNNRLGLLDADRKLFKTINGGKTWNKIDSISSISHIFMVDSSHIWVGILFPDGGRIMSSIDGGNNWQTPRPAMMIEDMFFINKKQGMACGMTMTSGFCSATYDGGLTWSKKEITGNVIYFTSPAHGWLLPYWLETNDSGKTWHRVVEHDSSFESVGRLSDVVKSNNSNRIYIMGTKALLYTDDYITDISSRKGVLNNIVNDKSPSFFREADLKIMYDDNMYKINGANKRVKP